MKRLGEVLGLVGIGVIIFGCLYTNVLSRTPGLMIALMGVLLMFGGCVCMEDGSR